MCRLDRRGRTVAIANIEAAFPGKYSLQEKHKIARASYGTFARTMFELFWAPNLTEDFLSKHVTSEGFEVDTCRKDPNKAAIYACLHFCNFEWLGLAGAYTIAPGPVIAQKFRNPLLGPIFDRLRAAFSQASRKPMPPSPSARARRLFLSNAALAPMADTGSSTTPRSNVRPTPM